MTKSTGQQAQIQTGTELHTRHEIQLIAKGGKAEQFSVRDVQEHLESRKSPTHFKGRQPAALQYYYPLMKAVLILPWDCLIRLRKHFKTDALGRFNVTRTYKEKEKDITITFESFWPVVYEIKAREGDTDITVVMEGIFMHLRY